MQVFRHGSIHIIQHIVTCSTAQHTQWSPPLRGMCTRATQVRNTRGIDHSMAAMDKRKPLSLKMQLLYLILYTKNYPIVSYLFLSRRVYRLFRPSCYPGTFCLFLLSAVSNPLIFNIVAY